MPCTWRPTWSPRCRPVDRVEIRPLSLHIRPTSSGNRICFTLHQSAHLTVEVNGYHHALHLFASPLEECRVDPNDPKVRYFGPGIHRPGRIEMHSGETVYLAGGAVVHGAISAREAQGIRVLGRGILDLSGYERGVHFEDIRVSTPRHVPASEFGGCDETHTTEDVTVRRLAINGRPVRTAADGRITIGRHARNVRISAE